MTYEDRLLLRKAISYPGEELPVELGAFNTADEWDRVRIRLRVDGFADDFEDWCAKRTTKVTSGPSVLCREAFLFLKEEGALPCS